MSNDAKTPARLTFELEETQPGKYKVSRCDCWFFGVAKNAGVVNKKQVDFGGFLGIFFGFYCIQLKFLEPTNSFYS